jgi:P27 family predicted phage terminase small subunit
MPNTPGQGRRPKPTALKLVDGTARPDRMNPDEPIPPSGEVKCPVWLHGRARRVWRELEPVLKAMGVLTVADVAMFAALCETQAEFIDAREDVRKRGIEIERKRYDKQGREFYLVEDNPSVRIASDAGKRLKALMVEFGMSPSSRTRVTAQPKPKEKSPLEALMERRQG